MSSVATPTTTIVFVHAHPDDETLWTGLAIMECIERGHRVVVLTATLGEEGEVIPPELAHLEGSADLGKFRRGELERAIARLGAEVVVLDGYRDSGMAGSSAAEHPDAFAGVPLAQAARSVGAALAALAPEVVVTYDADGGYGHPDHVRCHDAVRAALSADGSTVTLAVARADAPIVVDRPDLVERQKDALRAHRTQVTVGPDWFALSNEIRQPLTGVETYAVIDPMSGATVEAGEVPW